jgi:hypothetical protein
MNKNYSFCYLKTLSPQRMADSGVEEDTPTETHAYAEGEQNARSGDAIL